LRRRPTEGERKNERSFTEDEEIPAVALMNCHMAMNDPVQADAEGLSLMMLTVLAALGEQRELEERYRVSVPQSLPVIGDKELGHLLLLYQLKGNLEYTPDPRKARSRKNRLEQMETPNLYVSRTSKISVA